MENADTATLINALSSASWLFKLSWLNSPPQHAPTTIQPGRKFISGCILYNDFFSA
jgi:hypothetical protein